MKRCTVTCDTPAGIAQCELQLSDEATIDTALTVARTSLGSQAVNWDRAGTGIYGRVYARDHVWADGDRIEVYRALQLDPRARRRERAKVRSARDSR